MTIGLLFLETAKLVILTNQFSRMLNFRTDKILVTSICYYLYEIFVNSKTVDHLDIRKVFNIYP